MGNQQKTRDDLKPSSDLDVSVKDAQKINARFGVAGAHSKDHTQCLVITRLLCGVSLDEWASFSKELSSDNWTAVSLQDSNFPESDSMSDIIDKLVYQRDHDPMTGLANRRYFENFLDKELERVLRYAQSVSLAIVDLDKFKEMNDAHGHLYGDFILKEFSRFLKENHRVYDLCVRYGGDEFVVVMPGIHPWMAKRTMEASLKSLSLHPFVYEGVPPRRLTFSCGVTGAVAERGYTSREVLLKQADDALYVAKKNGRNQVCVSEKLGADPLSLLVNQDEKKLLFTNPVERNGGK